jgi:hypothetical protein
LGENSFTTFFLAFSLSLVDNASLGVIILHIQETVMKTDDNPTDWPGSLIGTAILVWSTVDGKDEFSRKGRIIQRYHERILVEWFSWLTGEPLFATFHTLEEVTRSEWRFFKNIEDADAYCANNKASILSSN